MPIAHIVKNTPAHHADEYRLRQTRARTAAIGAINTLLAIVHLDDVDKALSDFEHLAMQARENEGDHLLSNDPDVFFELAELAEHAAHDLTCLIDEGTA